MIPFNLLGGQDQQAFLNFLVHFVTLLGQQTFFDDCQRILREHVAYLFDYQPLLRFGRYVRLISQILSKQNVVKEYFGLLFGVRIYFIGMVLYVLHEKLMQSFFLHAVEHDLVDGFSKEGFAKSALDVARVCLI